MASKRKSSPRRGGSKSKAAKGKKKRPVARAAKAKRPRKAVARGRKAATARRGKARAGGKKKKPARAKRALKRAPKRSAGSSARSGRKTARSKKAPAKLKARAAKTKAAKVAKTKTPARAPKGRPAVPARARAAQKPATPAAVVRPLGVLPPEARARTRRSSVDGPRIAYRVNRKTSSTKDHTPQGAERLTHEDLKEFEQRLLMERQKIAKEMGHLESNVLNVNPRDSSGDLSGYSFHMADAGTDSMEREKAFLFASSEGRLLYEINDALRRLYNGDYGMCESCGQPIARARLEAIPHARQCVPCKSKEEQAGRSAQ